MSMIIYPKREPYFDCCYEIQGRPLPQITHDVIMSKQCGQPRIFGMMYIPPKA